MTRAALHALGRSLSTTVRPYDEDMAMRTTYSPEERDRVRSLWLHRAVLRHLDSDPGRVLDSARAVLARRLAKTDHKGSARLYDERWVEILERGLDAVVALLEEESDEADVLRSCSPFAGVLTPEERQQVLDAFERFWRERDAAASAQ